MRTVSKKELALLLENIILSERQEFVFTNFFIRKKDVCFIADALFVSPRVVSREIHDIRRKILAQICRE